MVQISAVIITYNEEDNIRRCIASAQNVADQVLVVDSYSEDKTPDICREMAVDFVQHPFEGYMDQKNYAMEKAQFDHILGLDADEILSEELMNAILEAKSNWAFDGYAFNRLTNYCGQWIWHCGWYPDRKTRLWDRRKGRWSGGNIHEGIQMKEAAKTKTLNGNLLHYSFPSIASHVETTNKYSDIVAHELCKKGVKPNIFIHLFLNPVFTFFKKYFLKKGLLDGYYGMVICIISSYHNFLKYAKARALISKKAKASF